MQLLVGSAHTTFQERSADALDYSRVALDSLVVGHGQLVHAGWIHSHFARLGGGRSFDPLDPRPKPGSLSWRLGSTQGERLQMGIEQSKNKLEEDNHE